MAENMSDIQLWEGPSGINIPASLENASQLIPYAADLSERQRDQIAKAFEIGAYDMASEYAWKKCMTKLKETIGMLGMKFIGEMLGRDDIDDATSVDAVITDHLAIQLAEQLGIVNATAALKLRHANELITHFFSRHSHEEIDAMTATMIIRSSVQYVLGERHIEIAVEFSQFRERLIGETLSGDDPHVIQIVNSAPFYLRTVLSVLLYAVRNDAGARLEHALANLNMLVPAIWPKISDQDRWSLGSAYRDVTATGNSQAIFGLKSALMKVKGFDYVPESLRSTTFVDAARKLLDVHFAFNNFYNEPAALLKLSSLGTVIPSPALPQCMQAYLSVYLGNVFGVSNTAAPLAFDQLCQISYDRWNYYFSKIIQSDEVVLAKFSPAQIARFSRILNENNLFDLGPLPRGNQEYYVALLRNDPAAAKQAAQYLIGRFRGAPRKLKSA